MLFKKFNVHQVLIVDTPKEFIFIGYILNILGVVESTPKTKNVFIPTSYVYHVQLKLVNNINHKLTLDITVGPL
jgi:hypothetical protein